MYIQKQAAIQDASAINIEYTGDARLTKMSIYIRIWDAELNEE